MISLLSYLIWLAGEKKKGNKNTTFKDFLKDAFGGAWNSLFGNKVDLIGEAARHNESDTDDDKVEDMFSDWFLGSTGLDVSKDDNESYLQKLIADQRAYGEAQINDARQWWLETDSTRYQRAFNDIEAAGYNPWLALQSGGLDVGSVPYSDSGSALGATNTSFGMSNTNSSSAIIVAIIAAIFSMLK